MEGDLSFFGTSVQFSENELTKLEKSLESGYVSEGSLSGMNEFEDNFLSYSSSSENEDEQEIGYIQESKSEKSSPTLELGPELEPEAELKHEEMIMKDDVLTTPALMSPSPSQKICYNASVSPSSSSFSRSSDSVVNLQETDKCLTEQELENDGSLLSCRTSFTVNFCMLLCVLICILNQFGFFDHATNLGHERDDVPANYHQYSVNVRLECHNTQNMQWLVNAMQCPQMCSPIMNVAQENELQQKVSDCDMSQKQIPKQMQAVYTHDIVLRFNTIQIGLIFGILPGRFIHK